MWGWGSALAGGLSRALRGGALAVALCGAGVPIAAQEAGIQPSILTLDQERFFNGSAFGRAALLREDQATKDLSAENLTIEQGLEAEERDLTTRRATLPAAEFAALATAFDLKVEDIRRAQDAKSRSIARRREEDQQQFFQAAVPVLGALLTEMGAVAILDKSAIILSLSSIDVTDAAIARVDAALGDGTGVPDPTVPPTEPSAAPLEPTSAPQTEPTPAAP
jgi:Skp family chaperone for outer membrane proteins